MADIIVLFEVKPTPDGMKRYLDLATALKPLLKGFEGFIRAERFSSLTEEGKLLSMNVWSDESAVERWRNMVEHRMSQQEGREKLFESDISSERTSWKVRQADFRLYGFFRCQTGRSIVPERECEAGRRSSVAVPFPDGQPVSEKD